MVYRCHVCGEDHDDLPDLGADKPDQWFGISPEQRGDRVRLTGDTCVIDAEQFFIRGVLYLPLIDVPPDAPADRQQWGLGVWVSQSERNFQTYIEQFDTADIGPFFGWLCTAVRTYAPTTAGLKTRARFRGNNQRPTIELEPTAHPLSVDQRSGITVARAWSILHAYTDGHRA